jgi:predicted RNA-binding Zn-ribbon protein involved in translation (DUF1610 family)
MFTKIKENLQSFFVIWLILIILNQIFIFGACFAPYCLIAALPHTGLIAGLIVIFMNKEEIKSEKVPHNKINSSEFLKKDEELNQLAIEKNRKNSYIVQEIENEIDFIDDIQNPFCPKCGSKMILRTAKTGKYEGSKFWGCTSFPKCKSIINI